MYVLPVEDEKYPSEPTITSEYPSPFASPAEETENPKLFVEVIIPTQVLLRSNIEDSPLFFSPVHISVTGRP